MRFCRGFILVLLAAGLAWGPAVPAGAGLADRLYFENYPTTTEDIVKVWGRPIKRLEQPDGSEVLVFAYGYAGGIYENRYFVVKDGRVIDGGLNYQEQQGQ